MEVELILDLTQQTYELIAEEYASHTVPQGETLRRNLTRFARELGDKGVVLDAGIGPGRDAKWLRDRGFSVFGLDYSFNMLKQSDISSVQADVRNLPFRDKTFDGIVCNAMLHHIPPQYWEHIGRQFWRILKPGGYLHITTRYGKGKLWDTISYGGHWREFWLANQWQLFAAFRQFDLYSLGKVPQDFCVHGIKTDWLYALLRKE